MLCHKCLGREERPCSYEHLTRDYVKVLLPALRQVAYRYGYAIGTHGSQKTDIDLIACPWRDLAINAHALVEAIQKATEAIIGWAEIRGEPEKKPNGRLAWSIHLTPAGVDGPYIDLSVMPIGEHKVEETK